MFTPHDIRAVCQAGKDRDPAWYRVHRRVSIHLTALLLRTPVTLNQVSLAMIAAAVLGAALWVPADLRVNLLGTALLYMSFLLDKVDGEMARFRGQPSPIGILLDRFHHRLAEPLLLLAVGVRAGLATDSAVPVIAALAGMLAANTIEETQQLPAFIAAKHARETGAWPVAGAGPGPGLQRVAAVMRSLKVFRMFLTQIPLVLAVFVAEALTGRVLATGFLITTAVALWVYVLFQAWLYFHGQLAADLAALDRALPARAAGEDCVQPERRPRAAVPSPSPERKTESAAHPVTPLVLLLGVCLIVGVAPAQAATYYVDASSPNASTNGPGTEIQPYSTISSALAARGAAGTTLLVKPGVYRETVTPAVSGTPAQPLVLRATGPGAIIDGADDFTNPARWTNTSGNIWRATTVNWSPKQVFANGVRLTVSTASTSALPTNSFRYVAGQGLYVNVGGPNPASQGCLVGRRANAVVLNGRSWVVVEGFTITRTEDRTVQVAAQSNDVTLLGNTITFSNKYGIYVSDCARVRIASNVVSDHNHHGIMLTVGSTQCVVEDNESFRNAVPGTRAANGLYLYGATENVIRRNKWHDNQDTGQHFQTGADDNVSVNNLSWNNGDHGFDHLGARGAIHVGDVAYGNFKDGFSIEGSSPNTVLSNCIAVNNGLTTGEFNLWVDNSSVSGFVSNDNLFWNRTSQAPVKYIATIYSTVAAYAAFSGRDTRTLQADPRFVDAATGNFHLRADSPAIDNGDSRHVQWTALDAEGNPRIDDLAVANTGLGAVTFADRGALEYQPAGLPPVAALLATPASGTAPVTVTLNASASTDPEGAIVSYLFDFGDGTSAGPQSSPLANHTYAAGAWTATVTVIDAQGLTATASAAVFSNRPPAPVLSVTPATGHAPLSVTAFAAGSSDSDGQIVAYTFDFGDGTIVGPQTSPTATHNYGTGTWLARLTVRDERGATATLATPVTVVVGAPNQPPVAALTLTPSLGPAPLSVVVDASGSSDPDGSIQSYAFDFGDGTQLAAQPNAAVAHTFPAGTRTVTVTVTDSDGGTATATASVTATTGNQSPNGVITAPASNVTVSAGQGVLFTSIGSDPDPGSTLRYAWDFGGGAPGSLLQNPGPVVFSQPGSYTVTLTVRDGLDLADPTPDTRLITVLPADTTVAADEVHWTITGQTSVTFDWRGPVNTLRYGTTTDYTHTVLGVTPTPLPYSSPGPFWEARITGLQENTLYHYSIAGGPDHTFRTPPPRGSSGFTVMAEGDIGAASDYPKVAIVQSQIAAQTPAFVLALGDLTYANENGQHVVDDHFNDVMAWSRDAAYMPVWGNHEWEKPTDDLRNYKGRFDLPNPRTTPDIPAPNDGGEDWYWFDYGNVRFIAYPEPFSGALDHWVVQARALMDSAQADPVITHIVTFGHRPAYSSGHHSGETRLKGYLDELGATHSKYVLNLNGHSHNYERSFPQNGVVHITAGGGGSPLEGVTTGDCIWGGGCPPPAWSAFRAMHRGALRLRFTAGGIEGAYLCGPSSTGPNDGPDDRAGCTLDSIIDSFVIGTPTPDRAPVVSVPALIEAVEDSLFEIPVSVSDPDGDPVLQFSADLSRLPQGAAATFVTTPDLASGVLRWRPTFADSGLYTVTFSASNALAGAATTAIRVADADRAPQIATVPVLGAGVVQAVLEDSVLTWSVSASDPDGQPVTSLTALVVPAPPGSAVSLTLGAGSTGTFQWRPSFIDSGAYIVRFTAWNARQTVLEVPVQVVNVDRAPVVTAPAAEAVPESGLLTFSFTVSDPDSDAITALTAELEELPAGHDAVFTPGPGNRTGTFTWTPTFVDSGFYHVTFVASNALTTRASTAINVGATDRAPIVFAPIEVFASEGAPLSIGVVALDPDSQAVASLTADLSGLPAGHGATFSVAPGQRTGTLSWTPGYAAAGDWTVRWIANNTLAETTVTVVHVANVDRAPVVSAPVSLDRPAGSLITIAVTALDPDDDAITALTADLSALPAGHGAVFVPAADRRSGLLTWTPGLTDTGSFTLTFAAVNALSGSAATLVRVQRPNQPPAAALSASPRTGNAPLVVAFDASASSDPDGAILSYRFDFGDGASAGPQASAATAHAYAAGSWTAKVTVTDAAGAIAVASLPITVAAAPPGTNLVANPSFESNALGWSSYSNSIYTRIAGGFDGNTALQITGPASLSGFGINDSPNWVGITGAAGTRYRFSAWVRSASAFGSAKLQIREYQGNTKIGPTLTSAPVQLTPEWQLVTVDHVVQVGGTTLDFQVYDQPVLPNEVFVVDNIAISVVPASSSIAATNDSSSTRGEREIALRSSPLATPLVFAAGFRPTSMHGEATLEFTVTQPGPVEVSLFDASGRRVRRLYDARALAPGSYRIPFDGRSDDGVRLASGIYFYRLHAQERTQTGRFAVVR